MTEPCQQVCSEATRWLTRMRKRFSRQRRLARALVAGGLGLLLLELAWLCGLQLRVELAALVPLAGLGAAVCGPGVSLPVAARRLDRRGRLQTRAQAFLEAGADHPFRPWLAAELLAAAPRLRPRFEPPRALVPLLCLAFVGALPGLMPSAVDARLLPQLPRRAPEAAFGSSSSGTPLRAAEDALESALPLDMDEALAALQGTPLNDLAEAVRAGDVEATTALLAEHQASDAWAALQQQLRQALGRDALVQAARAAGGGAGSVGDGPVLSAELSVDPRLLPRREPVPDAYRSLVENWFAGPGGS